MSHERKIRHTPDIYSGRLPKATRTLTRAARLTLRYSAIGRDPADTKEGLVSLDQIQANIRGGNRI